MSAHLRQPDFQRLVKTLFAGRADAVPLIELGVHPKVKSFILGRPLVSTADEVAFMHTMGYDFVKIQPVIDLALRRQVPAKPDTQQPGIAMADRAWAAEHRGLITGWKEFEDYPWPSTADIDYSRFEHVRADLPEGMGVIGQYGDIFTNVWELMGFETFAVATREQPELVQALFARVSELIVSMFEAMAGMDWVGALWYSDDIAFSSGLMVSPEFLDQNLFPHLRKIGELARRRGIPFIYHSDGNLWDVLDTVIACGVTALHPLEPKSMDIAEVKRRYGRRLCVCGGVDVDLLARGTPDTVRALVRTLSSAIAPGGGWCAGSSNSIPDYVPVENYLAMVDTVLEYGVYL